MSYRLPPVPGEWIDRTQRVSFTFEGTRYTGYAGDTISSTLWAAGQRILGRSFKYHRPRGILSAANHDVNTLMQAGQQLNLRADVTQLQVDPSSESSLYEGGFRGISRMQLEVFDPPLPPLRRGESAQSSLYEGESRGISDRQSELELSAVNTVGGVMGDRASVINAFSRFLPVGFYYKAFHSKRFFPLWERMIRSMTGLGKADITTPHIRTAKRYDFCDLLVIGAGISGMTAALTAAEAGADVVIVDENAQAGGAGGYQRGGTTDRFERVKELAVAIATHPNIRLYTNTQAAGYYADHWIPLVHRDYLSKMRAKAVIVASGAYEQPAVFRNNDLPGVMLASAAQRLIYRYAVKPMHRAVVFTANSDGYRAALDLRSQGIEVQAIVDLRPKFDIQGDHPPTPQFWGASGSQSPPSLGNLGGDQDWHDLLNQIRSHNIPIYNGYGVYEARPNPARDGVSSAVICPMDANGQPHPEAQQAIACDGIVMSVGWAPAANLLYQAGTKMQFDPQIQQFVPDVLPTGVFACGRVNGVYAIEQKRLDGQRAGLAAAAHLGLIQERSDRLNILHTQVASAPPPPQSWGVSGTQSPPNLGDLGGKTQHIEEVQGVRTHPPQRGDEFGVSPSHPWAIVPHPHGKEFVDFDEDLQLKDFYNAAQEGFDNIELLKRYTTVGMGPSQGKHSNMNALRILARITGKTSDQVGTTTARPFFHPVPMSHLAGRGFTPERRTPLHSRHAALGAQFMLAGVWRRPEYYHQAGQSREACIQAEVKAVRTGVGIIDVGTLGKMDIRGAGAAELLERVYTGRYANLKVGMSRYALMLDELGVVMDDGVVARLGVDHFYFTTTTSGAANIYRELTRLNTMWQLDCGIVNLTGARAAMNLAGPCSREVLSQLTDLDLSATAFPYLGVRHATVAGIPALLMRVGFVGEWGYEIHVAAESAPALWDALLAVGTTVGIRPFGVEAQRLLRLEKGHLIVGQDTDGLTTPLIAGLEWAVKQDKPFFIGQRSLKIVQSRPVKQKMVGFMLPSGFTGTAPQECHLAIAQGEIVGRVTSIAFSPTLDRYIGLAYLQPELATAGNPFTIRLSDGSLVTAIVSPTPFYDPENLRQKELAPQRQEVPV